MTCLWPLSPDTLPDDWESYGQPTRDNARELASRTIERLTGYRVGVCPVTIEVCRRLHSVNCSMGLQAPSYGFAPVSWGGRWMNTGTCTDGCGLRCEVKVPGPIGRIDSVVVGGTTLAPADYRIVNENLIEWTGVGDCPFPVNGPVTVTYVNAYLPGPGGEFAATVLAVEFVKAIAGKNGCRLPPGVTAVVRQGISMNLPAGAFPDGRTGLREVDTFVALWNPHNIDPPQVWSPDLPTHRRIGG